MAVADPSAAANVCSSGRAFPREKLPIITEKNTFLNFQMGTGKEREIVK